MGGFAQDSCCFEFGAEWLYMMDSFDQPYYAQNIGTGALFNGKRVTQDQKWHSGYRLEAVYYLPNGKDHLGARWTHFPNFAERDSDSQPVNGLDGILTHPADPASDFTFAKIRDRFNFYYLEVLFGRPVYCCSPLLLNLDVGIQYAKIDWRENVYYTEPAKVQLIKNQSEFIGIGPEVALDFSYGLSGCFSVEGRALSALLVNRKGSRSKENDSTLDSGLEFSSHNERYWYVDPMVDFRLGLNYHYPFSLCGCNTLNVNIEVGYEIIHYFKAVDRIYFVDSTSVGSSETQHMDFSMHGPYVHLGVCF